MGPTGLDLEMQLQQLGFCTVAKKPEGTIVASVPVYSESILSPEPEAEDAAATSPEGAETASKTQEHRPRCHCHTEDR